LTSNNVNCYDFQAMPSAKIEATPMNINRPKVLAAITGAPALLLSREASAQDALPDIDAGRFEGSVAPLKSYEIPQWFRDGDFDIWAHWGPRLKYTADLAGLKVEMPDEKPSDNAITLRIVLA
jgi:hypothetical protein